MGSNLAFEDTLACVKRVLCLEMGLVLCLQAKLCQFRLASFTFLNGMYGLFDFLGDVVAGQLACTISCGNRFWRDLLVRQGCFACILHG